MGWLGGICNLCAESLLCKVMALGFLFSSSGDVGFGSEGSGFTSDPQTQPNPKPDSLTPINPSPKPPPPPPPAGPPSALPPPNP